MPCTKKLANILFYSTSKCFSEYVDTDTVIMSTLLNRNLKVSVEESAVQISNRTKPKPLTPFTAAKAKANGREAAPERPPLSQLWDPVPQVFESPVTDGSALSRARQQVYHRALHDFNTASCPLHPCAFGPDFRLRPKQ